MPFATPERRGGARASAAAVSKVSARRTIAIGGLLCAACAPLLPAPPAPEGVSADTLRLERTAVERYRPSAEPRATVILVHGFTRDRTTLAELGLVLAAAGFEVLLPDLPHIADRAANARFVAGLVARVRKEGGQPIFVGGFSAGAAVALEAAAGQPEVAGLVALDPVARDAAKLAASVQSPAFVLRAPPGPCNANGAFAAALAALPNLVADRVFEEATHCDFEGPTDALCRRTCGEESPLRQARIRAAVLEALETMLQSHRR